VKLKETGVDDTATGLAGVGDRMPAAPGEKNRYAVLPSPVAKVTVSPLLTGTEVRLGDTAPCSLVRVIAVIDMIAPT
jgi:hypothetical protein